MTKEDLPGAAAIERECFGASAWSVKSLSDELEREDSILLAARIGDCLAGYVGMRVVLDEGYVNDIAVPPRFRRHGIGRALVKALLERGRALSLAFITLEARVSNTGAIALYRQMGFRDAGLRRGFYDFPREDACLMTYDFD